MRQDSGSGRGLAVMVAAALSVVVLSVAVVPVGRSGPAPATAQLSGDSPSASGLFKSLAEGAAGEVGGQLAGWALSALGLSSGDEEGAELASIKNDLDTIISQLSDIEAELSALEAAITQLDCDSLTATTNSARTLIDSLADSYQDFVDVGAGTLGPAAVPPVPLMANWARQVVDDRQGIWPAVVAISNALLQAGSGQGIISACLNPAIIPPPAAGTFDDTPYYDQVADLVNFYYGYQAQGLLLLQEAYHFLAQQASPVSADPDDPGAVCTSSATGPTALFWCQAAAQDTNTLYERLAAQFAMAGLPYTDDDVIVLNNGGPNPPLFVRSLEKFTEAAGDNCPTPLTSAAPCGHTVATGAAVANSMPVDYAGYSPWWVATSADLTDAVANRGSDTPGQFLDENGFENATNKIVLTPETTSFEVQSDRNPDHPATGTLRCFLDTDVTAGVACDSQVVASVLLQGAAATNCDQQGDPRTNNSWETGASLPASRNDFYTTTLEADPENCDEYTFSPQPGWLNGNTGQNARQFRWPRLRVGIDTGSCTAGRSPLNPGGVPTRCGPDFDTVFDTLVTRPVTCGGTAFGQCSSDGAALVGQSIPAGYWILESDGDVHAFGGVADPAGVKADLAVGETAIAIAGHPFGTGFWVLTDQGRILGRGTNVGLMSSEPRLRSGTALVGQLDGSALTKPGEQLSTLAANRHGTGLWVFTTAGRILSFGDAAPASDLAGSAEVLALDLHGPIVDSTSTADGAGVYMVGADGGVFATGTAVFLDSLRGVLTELHGPPGLPHHPIVGLTTDPDGLGYWLVGADGGVFAFDAPFRGSLPAIVPFENLVAPVTNMAPHGDGYVLVAGDGGLFNFSNLPFAGSAHGIVDSPVTDVATPA